MKKIIEKIKKNGSKITRPRKEILDYLAQAKQPLSAQEIHSCLKGINLASVYRNLKLFKKLAIVQTEPGESEEKYCLALKPHHHIICSACGYSESIRCNHNFIHKNFTDIKHQLKLTGLCRKCS